MLLICEKSARSRPCDGLVDLNALSALPRSARCLNVFHFVSRDDLHVVEEHQVEQIVRLHLLDELVRDRPRVAEARRPSRSRQSTATSHAVPTFGWFCALPHCILSANFESWSSPATFTRKCAFCSGNGNGVEERARLLELLAPAIERARPRSRRRTAAARRSVA